ncbi:MAG: hypothetical protein ACYDFT_05975 [Thermoplasmata archaeon]
MVDPEVAMRPKEDPDIYVRRNPHALHVLRTLAREGARPPSEVRKGLEIAPESFRQVVEHLEDLDLVQFRAARGARMARTHTGYGFKITVELTSEGRKWLNIVEDVLATLRQHAQEVAPAIAERWQEA